MAGYNERAVFVIGGGPAGAAAAIAARNYGAAVRIVEKSRVARHKVCGEFIPAEVCRVLNQLGAWNAFLDRNPARITRCRLRFGSRTKQWALGEPAFGLSRLELDRFLLNHAAARGASVLRGVQSHREDPDPAVAVVRANGRAPGNAAPSRLFGFKSHFEGPTHDAVELFFGSHGYVGVSPVENGITNVCGLAPESALRRYGFHFDDFVTASPELAGRLKPLTRRMPWLSTGPLVFSFPAGDASAEYAAGDALGFVDPFTGSGILNALLTGRMAGAAAAEGLAHEVYRRACRKLVMGPFTVSAILRTLLDWGCAGVLANLVPGEWIYRLTRAAVQLGR